MIHPEDLQALAELLRETIDERMATASAQLRTETTRQIAEAIQSIPAGKDGKDGVDGKDGSSASVDIEAIVGRVHEQLTVPRPETVQEFIREQVRVAIAEIPKPKDGERGKDGVDGKDGLGLTGPKGEPGPKGDPGESIQGPKGDPGEAGRSVTPEEVEAIAEKIHARHAGEWALDFERRAQDQFRHAIERMPAPKDGKDGTDGFGLEDLTITDDGDGRVTLIFKRGELEKSHTIRLYRLLDQGVFSEGKSYQRGDNVSFGGSLWIAQRDDVTEKPGTGDGWRLAVKKGRDGRDGKPPEPLNSGPVRLT